MIEFIKDYLNPNEERINTPLMNREYDDNLVEYIINSCKSLEALDEIEFLGYDLITDEKMIDMNDYITTRKKTRKKTDIKYMYMQDSRYMELRLRFKLTCKDDMDIITKKLLVPIPDDNGYYTIKGKKYFLLYQLVDASTYTTRHNLTLKSLMPVTVKRTSEEFTDTEGSSYTAPTYVVYIFRKEVKALQLYFAKIGVKKTLKYFKMEHVMRFVENEGDREKNLYFQINSKLFLEVNKYFFLEHQYVQTMAFMVLSVAPKRLSMEHISDKDYWIEQLGASTSVTNAYNHHEKGQNMLRSFGRMLDETTKEILKLDDENRKNIYAVVRWMIQNFNELRKKDNLDLSNKRLRCNEYVASLLTAAFSERVNRVIAKGNRVTIEKVRDIFKFPGNILMEKLYSSGLLRYDDRINDMDFFSKFRFTLKGPNALGSKNDNNISIKYRGIHPSYLGRIDLNVCGTSDPGSSGVITPFCETEGLYFNGAQEPEGGTFEFEREARQFYKDEHPELTVVDPYEHCESVEDVFAVQHMHRDLIRQTTISRRPTQSGMTFVRFNLGDDEDEI